MAFLNKTIICILLLMCLVSGCGAVTISCGTGDSSGNSGYTETLGAKNSDAISESTILAGSSLSQSFAGSGSKAETFSVSNTAGDHADVGFDIINSASYSGSHTLSPQTAKYAKATEALDVNNADSINAFANAYSRDGRAAEAVVMITKGSLIGYTNSAYATSLKATVSQKAKSASDAGDMSFGEKAGIFDGNNLVVYAGDDSINPPSMPPGNDQLTAYSGSASALKDSVQKDLTIGSISSSYISGGPVAWNMDANGNMLTSSDTVISITNGQISKYNEKATATRNSARASMKIGSATGDAISSASNVVNLEDDNVNTKLDMGTGSLSGYSIALTAAKTSAAASLDASAKCSIGANIIFDSTAYNKEGDNIGSYTELCEGSISGYSYDATAKLTSATTDAKIKSASGSSVEIKSNGQDKALVYESQYMWNPSANNWDQTLVSYNAGEGDFAAKNLAFKNVEVATKATQKDIDISTKGFGKKTALILDPRRWEFSQEPVIYIDGNGNQVLESTGIPEICDPIMTFLEQSGYAVTYYSDAAVSKTKVGQMDNYWVSVINTHMNPFELALSKSSDGKTCDTMQASEFKKAYTKNNGLTLMVGCNSFTNIGSGTWIGGVSKAQCIGGTTDYWSIFYSRTFLIKYFQDMAEGQTASEANQDVYDTFKVDGVHLGDYNYEANGGLVGGCNDQGEPANPSFSQKKLYLAGSNINFKL